MRRKLNNFWFTLYINDKASAKVESNLQKCIKREKITTLKMGLWCLPKSITKNAAIAVAMPVATALLIMKMCENPAEVRH